MLETRSFDLADAGTYSNGRKFHGEAVVYGQPSPLPTVDGRTVMESIARGAFAETSAPLFREHRPELLLARNSVRLSHGEHLVVDAELLDTAAAREARELLEAEELRGMSIGFLPTGSGFAWSRRGSELHRSLESGRLVEISLVALPAYAGTSASVRSIAVPQHLARPGRDTKRWSALLSRLSA